MLGNLTNTVFPGLIPTTTTRTKLYCETCGYSVKKFVNKNFGDIVGRYICQCPDPNTQSLEYMEEGNS